MKFQAETNGNKHEVEIVRGDALLIATVDGRKYELEASEPEPGVYLFKSNGKVCEVFVSSPANPSEPATVRVRGEVREVRIIDPKRLRNAKGDAADADGKVEIKTAMPGKVVRILISQGDDVQKGDGVIVVEAMKMQNEMKSPKDGTIAEIRAAEGDTVAAGDVLIIIE